MKGSPAIADLVAGQAPGLSLDQAFYVRDDVFARDLALLLDRWTCVGHESEVPSAGDYIVAELGPESTIVVRGADGVVRALANVCRHRGSRVCVEARGSATILTCPYHAWTYHLDGRLRAAREMSEGFDPASHGLTPLPIEIIGGLIFVSFGLEPPSLEAARRALTAMTDHYGWRRARIAQRKRYAVAANWKLVMENYHECYHCGPAHPEFSVLHTLARPNARKVRSAEESALDKEAAAIVVPDVEAWPVEPDGREVVRVMHSPLADGSATGSADGAPLAPFMGAFEQSDQACVFAEVGYLSAFLAYADHGVIYRFIPRGVLATEMEVIWLVDAAAEEGRDYDPERLTWLWDVTSLADKKIIERNQAGVLSRFYRPGPFSRMEPGTKLYVERYLSDLARTAETEIALGL
jgi:phenylpropionate dioxygenase-like ring-hydroxylating dioxygenase large terminal subunit